MNEEILLKRHEPKKSECIQKQQIVCGICGNIFLGHVNQKYCSDQCRKIGYDSAAATFRLKNPGAMKVYNKRRRPGYWKEKLKKERLQIIEELGGECCVEGCPVSNPYHLHVDFIPTMRGTGLRHPKHKSFVLRHKDKFRLICANHHYELTLTGKIEGSAIVQPMDSKMRIA